MFRLLLVATKVFVTVPTTHLTSSAAIVLSAIVTPFHTLCNVTTSTTLEETQDDGEDDFGKQN